MKGSFLCFVLCVTGVKGNKRVEIVCSHENLYNVALSHLARIKLGRDAVPLIYRCNCIS